MMSAESHLLEYFEVYSPLMRMNTVTLPRKWKNEMKQPRVKVDYMALTRIQGKEIQLMYFAPITTR